MNSYWLTCDVCDNRWIIHPDVDIYTGGEVCAYCEGEFCVLHYDWHTCHGHKRMADEDLIKAHGDEAREMIENEFDERTLNNVHDCASAPSEA